MAFNQKNPPWQRNAGHQNMPSIQAIVSFSQTQPVYNPNIGLQQQQNISILPQIGMQQQQQQALYSQTVQYPTSRPINPIGFQNQQQSQRAAQPAVNQNTSKFNPNNRVFSGTGVVTKLQNDFGFIDDEVFFHKNTCVKGIIPKWNASRVQVLSNSNSSSSGHGNSSQVRTQSALYSNTSSHQSDSRSSNTRNRYSPAPRKDMPRSSNSRSTDDYDESERRRKRDERERDRDRDRERDRDRDRDRAAPYREKQHNARSSERGRERERSPIRKPSPKRRRVRSMPRYMVQVPKHLLTIQQADVLELRRRYTNLYIPSDFFISDIRWTNAFPPDAPFSIRSPCQFHVLHKDVEPPALTAGGGDSGLDPPDADYLYSAKVMLLSTPPMAEFYNKCFSKEDGEERNYMHPTRLISFLVGMRGKNETMAIGGPWSPSLDGTDPQSDPAVLIRTAKRTCRALTGIDLSGCSQWYRFVELYYRRSESYHKGRLIPSRVETVVIFLPDVRSCQPTRVEWEQLRLGYKASLASVLNCSSNSCVVDEAPTSADPPAAVAQATPNASGADDVKKSSTTSPSIAASSDAASVDAESLVAASLVAPEQAEPSEAEASAGAIAAATVDADAAASSQQEVGDGTAVVAEPGSSPEPTAAAAVGAVSAENDTNTLAAQPASDSNTSGSNTQAEPTAAAAAAAAAETAETAVAVAAAETTPPAVSIMDTTEGSSTTSNTAATLLQEFKKMKVVELKAELTSRNLPIDGVKSVLLSRLSEAVIEEEKELHQKAQHAAEQLSKDMPEPAQEAELQEVKKEPIEQVKMETDAAVETAVAMETEAEPAKAVEVQEETLVIKEEKDVEVSATKGDGGDNVVATKSESKPGTDAPKALAGAGEGEEKAPKTEAKPTVVAPKKETPVKLSEKERQALERRYDLPRKPHLLVHPSRVAKSGKFDCSVMSLSVLLDYRQEDTKEHSFEVALFSELFNEMLTRDFGFNIYRALCGLPQVNKESEESKKDGSADGGGKSATETGDGTSNGEEGGKATSTPASEKGDEMKKKSSQTDEKEQRDRKRARRSETVDEEGKARDKDTWKGLLVNSDMLLSFVYFDISHCGYIAEKDVEDLIYTLGLNLSRSQIRKTVSKGTVRDLLHYRRLTDQVQEVAAPTPQPEASIAPVDDTADADKAVESGAVAPDVEMTEGAKVAGSQPEMEVPEDVARGNTDYQLQLKASLEQILNEQNGEGHPSQQRFVEKNAVGEVSATKTGIVEYNGCVVDVGKMLKQVKRTESALLEMDKLLLRVQGKHATLLYCNTRATNKIRDLQSENKILTKQLSDSMRALRDAVQTQTDYFAAIHHVYERVRPIVHKPSRDGSSKRESSKETSSRAAVSKSKEKENKKDTATARKEDDKGTKEKGGDPPAVKELAEGDGSNNDGGSEETTTVTGGEQEQESPDQTTPSAMETDDANAAEKSANDGEQTSS